MKEILEEASNQQIPVWSRVKNVSRTVLVSIALATLAGTVLLLWGRLMWEITKAIF